MGWTYGRVCHYLFIYLLKLFIEHVHGLGPEQDSGEIMTRETDKFLALMKLTFSWGV